MPRESSLPAVCLFYLFLKGTKEGVMDQYTETLQQNLPPLATQMLQLLTMLKPWVCFLHLS